MDDQSFLIMILLLWSTVTLLTCFYKFKQHQKKQGMIWSTILNVSFFLFSSLMWFYVIAIDGMSQVFGVFLFGLVFIVIEVTLLLIFKFKQFTNK